MDRTTLTAALKPLERRGLVIVERDPKDKRSRVLALTAAGEDLLAEALPVWELTHRDVEQLLPAGAPSQLRKELNALAWGEIGIESLTAADSPKGTDLHLNLQAEFEIASTLRLPEKAGQPEAQGVKKRPLSERRRILIVDDEPIIADTVAMILRWQDFEVESFTDPFKALAAARDSAPNLLITDIGMPLMSGVELAVQVREHCPGCKVLLLSGQGNIDSLLETFNAARYDFDLLLKPIHPTELLSRVQFTLGVYALNAD
jgi:CheY-like chemotaxis protein